MSLASKPFEIGALRGAIYDFPDAGDLLPMHEHTPDNVHVTIVVRGLLKARGDGWEIDLKPGPIYDWNPGQRHEFEAIEPGSRVVNIIKDAAR